MDIVAEHRREERGEPNWDECVCTQCGRGGNEAELLLCEGLCGQAWHLGCLPVPLATVPEGEWFSAHCAGPPLAPVAEPGTPIAEPPPSAEPDSEIGFAALDAIDLVDEFKVR
eukprot:11048630-Alexandrium_andersonii.AAC.1